MSPWKPSTKNLEDVLKGRTRRTGRHPNGHGHRRQRALQGRVKQTLCRQLLLERLELCRHVSGPIGAHGPSDQIQSALGGIHIHTPSQYDPVSRRRLKANSTVAPAKHRTVDHRTLVLDGEVPVTAAVGRKVGNLSHNGHIPEELPHMGFQQTSERRDGDGIGHSASFTPLEPRAR